MTDHASNKNFVFRFCYELDDLLQAHTAQKKTRSLYRLSLILKVFFIVVIVVELLNFVLIFIIFVLIRHLSGNSAINDLVISVAITLAVFILLFGISLLILDETLLRWQIRRSFRKHQTGEVNYEIIIDSEGLQVNITDWKTWVGWSLIQRVYVYPNGFLIFSSAMDYLTIPNRVFEDPVEIEAFKDLLTQSIGKELREIK